MRSARKRHALSVALLCALMFCSLAARAWSVPGHRITALVAERLLTPEAAVGLKTLMGETSLATASVYLDDDKRALETRHPGSKKWHYDNRPVCDVRAPKSSYCESGDCASTQFSKHYRTLTAPQASVDDKRFALFVVLHLAGDVHQPLHASNHDDRGGNEVKVGFTLPGGQKRSNKLHAAWDTDFVKAAFETANERTIARQLLDRYAGQLGDWQRGSIDDWLAESYQIARTFAYGQLPGFRCGDAGFAKTKLVLDDAYVGQAVAMVPEQLAKAGVRIAYLLNQAFAK